MGRRRRLTGAPSARGVSGGAGPARIAFAALLVASATPALAIEFLFPVACTVGVDCAVQHYVDRAVGPEALDYRCSHQTYDGHDGTDIRVPDLADMEAGVAVLAATDGTVKAIRDGMPDVSIATGTVSVEDRECGNGVLIEHGDGWSTQYCHMKKGSVTVKPGDRIAAGGRLGEIGLSGNTEFPHLHFTVRRGDTTVDPYAPEPLTSDAACVAAGDPAGAMFAKSLPPSQTAYRPITILNAGFADGPVTMNDIEAGTLPSGTLAADAPAIVFYGRAIGVEAGDQERLSLTAPDGTVLAERDAEPAQRPKAQLMAFLGKKLRGTAWPQGTYRGRYAILRNGVEIAAKEVSIEIGP